MLKDSLTYEDYFVFMYQLNLVPMPTVICVDYRLPDPRSLMDIIRNETDTAYKYHGCGKVLGKEI